MARKTYIDAFDPEGKNRTVCEECGLCLQQCPVMKMGKLESQAEMGRLLKGHETERVFNEGEVFIHGLVKEGHWVSLRRAFTSKHGKKIERSVDKRLLRFRIEPE